MKSQLIAYLLAESEHIHWILDLGDEMHSIWDCGEVAFKNARAMIFLKVGWGGHRFSGGSKKFQSLCGAAAPDRLFLPQRLVGGRRSSFGTFWQECTIWTAEPGSDPSPHTTKHKAQSTCLLGS
jgi:hypothetical protein